MALAAAACTSIAADQRTFDGTTWRVTALNGEPTPPASSFQIRFAAESLSANFGCNTGSGDYRIDGGTLQTGIFARTEMACDYATDEPQAMPLMAWEDRGFAVLSQPMRMKWNSGSQLTLSNTAGSIALERVP